MKKNWLFRCITAFATVGLVATMAWGAGLFDRADQNILGNWRFYNDVTFKDDVVLTDATITATGKITATHIANVTRRIPVPLSSVFVDSSGPITSTTAPNLTTVDSVGAIVYDHSDETAEIQFDWYPDTHFTAMVVKMMCTSSHATGTDNAVDWGIFVREEDASAASVIIAQTEVSLTSTSLDDSPELVTLTLDATGVAAVTAGTSAPTVAVWNASTDSYTLEIKKLWIEETRDQ